MNRLHPNLAIPVITVIAALSLIVFRGKGGETRDPSKQEVRVAYFPNVTHAPAIIGLSKGIWISNIPNCRISEKVVNAGPEAMEAMLAGELDFAFVGPSPAINTFLKTKGRGLRIISGACQGGASLVRRAEVSIENVRGLDGKRIAVPQLGGTQDVSCRHFLAQNGLKPKDQGGTVEILAVKNPDILGLFKQKQIDAAWVPEPWASRIKADAGAVTVVDERDLWPGKKFTTTVLVVRKAFAEQHQDIVDAVVRANQATLDWMQANPVEAKAAVNSGLKKLTGKELKIAILDEAWSRVTFTSDPDRDSVNAFAFAAAEAGYSKDKSPDLAALFDERLSQGIAKH